jgi:hypothetical protein
MGIRSGFSKLKHAWNAFADWDQNYQLEQNYASGFTFGVRPDRTRLTMTNERSIIGAILTRLSVDAGAVELAHVRTDKDGRYLEDMNSQLNNCLTVEANIDQAASQLRQDIIMTMFDKGCVAIVPVDTTINPVNSNAYDVVTMRAAEIVAWFPEAVRVSLYNQVKGVREQIILPKSAVAIVENPFYSVMNEPSSTLQRLIRKLNMLDAVDEASSSGKLDLIIQLPYVIKSDARKLMAEQRRKDIEFQLKGSQYGIAYTDGTEKITQLNRPAENNLLTQVQYLTQMLYGQLGITDTIMNGTANEEAMLNYNKRTIEPIVRAITEAMSRTFLSKTARTQGQTIVFYRDPFALVPMGEFAKMADMLSRNEIVTPNELRSVLGLKPSKEKNADKLQNSNMPTAPPLQNTPRPAFPPSSRQALPASPQRQLTRTGGNSQNGT